MNLPNLITVFRLLLIPVFVIFLLEDKANLALITFGIAGVSDALDGFWPASWTREPCSAPTLILLPTNCS